MPRTKLYDVETTCSKAMHLFWKKGYSNTSISDLEQELGISRISIYHTFESKEGLFLRAADMYTQATKKMLHDTFKDQALSSIYSFFEYFCDENNKEIPHCSGCLLFNTISEVQTIKPIITECIIEYRSLIKDQFTAVLHANQKDLIDTLDIDAASELLVVIAMGFHMTNKLNDDLRDCAQVISQVQQLVTSWTKKEVSTIDTQL